MRLLVAACDPIALGILRAPGDCGVDIAIGEGQPLGNRLDYGGPSFGFFCATEEQIRRMPGRIAGETTDVDGRRGFVLALQTREQHIRREKATHNICTAQALNALGAVIHLSWLGARGMTELGELLVRRTAYAKEALVAVEGVSLLHDAPVVREFAISFDAPTEAVLEHCAERGIAAGVPLGPEYGNGLLVAITERRDESAHRSPRRRPRRRPRRGRGRRRGGGRRPRAGSRRRRHEMSPPAATPPAEASHETPMQRDRAVTIYERSVPGRRAAAIPRCRRSRRRRTSRWRT